MADFVTDLANRAGIDKDMARKGAGAVLAYLKRKVPAETFAKLSNSVPQADDLMASSDAAAGQSKSPGGVFSAVKGALSKMMGGEAGLAGKLNQHGFSAEDIPGFLKHAVSSLKANVPEDAHQQLDKAMPG
jgi:hypothetical protein